MIFCNTYSRAHLSDLSEVQWQNTDQNLTCVQCLTEQSHGEHKKGHHLARQPLSQPLCSGRSLLEMARTQPNPRRLWAVAILLLPVAGALSVRLHLGPSTAPAHAVEASSWGDLHNAVQRLGGEPQNRCFVDGERTMLREFEARFLVSLLHARLVSPVVRAGELFVF